MKSEEQKEESIGRIDSCLSRLIRNSLKFGWNSNKDDHYNEASYTLVMVFFMIKGVPIKD